MKILIFIIRIAVGCLFIASGFEKLISPYQNFLYVIQSYELGMSAIEELAARIVPWAEFFLGIFLLLGLWLPIVLRLFSVLVFSFILVVGQALFRGLNLTECGCFGGLLAIPLQGVLLLDTTLLVLFGIFMVTPQKTSFLSLDRLFCYSFQINKL